MGSPKQVTTSDNQYGYFQKPSWEGLSKLEDWNPQADPTIGANFGQQKNDLERSFVSPTGSYQTPELREQQMRSGIQNIGQNQAIATRADQYGQNQLKLGQLGQVAQLGAPEFAQTKGTQTSQEKGGTFGKILGGALGMASSFI
jgi:hypothetical protein